VFSSRRRKQEKYRQNEDRQSSDQISTGKENSNIKGLHKTEYSSSRNLHGYYKRSSSKSTKEIVAKANMATIAKEIRKINMILIHSHRL
jgi:hypothetical protein